MKMGITETQAKKLAKKHAKELTPFVLSSDAEKFMNTYDDELEEAICSKIKT